MLDLSNVNNCEEKEITIPFNVDEVTGNDFVQNCISLWAKIEKALESQLNTRDHEWFDQYSLYPQYSTSSQTETSSQPKSSKLELIKTGRDFVKYLEYELLDVNRVSNSICLTLKV